MKLILLLTLFIGVIFLLGCSNLPEDGASLKGGDEVSGPDDEMDKSWEDTFCVDSDGGINISIAGGTTSSDGNGKILHRGGDACVLKDTRNGMENNFIFGMSSCEGENCYIFETYCEYYKGGFIDSGDYFPCESGCEDGACDTW